jgi:acetyl/propionyl-CoA carboxylase alpha subunit
VGPQLTNPISGARVAIANRGEIAVRIAATCRRLGAVPILLVGEPDISGFAARQIGRIELIGETGSELDVSRVVSAAQRVGADFLHPGYGFLSERADLVDACDEAGIRFVGPSAATLRICGDKLETRAAATRAGIPVLSASPPLDVDREHWLSASREVGFPLLVKPAGAGGGRGLRHVTDESGLVEAVLASRREVGTAGADTRIYLERELLEPRHVEVQLASDGIEIVVVGDRDCSIQRRHQKVIEEAPAPNINTETRVAVHEYARRVAIETGLRGVATCEFLLSGDGQIAFLEVNPRIQVEHPVTELVTGVDLVEWQLLIAAGGTLPLNRTPEPRGHAVEARLYAEDPWKGFFPTPGHLAIVSWPCRPDSRIDAGYESGDVIPAEYDAMIAKIIGHGSDRDSALAALRAALAETVVAGVATNLPWLVNLLDADTVQAGQATTRTAGEVLPSLPDRSLALVALLAHLLDRPTSSRVDAWSAIGPWRMTGPATIAVHGDDWEATISARRTANGWETAIGTETDPVRWWRDSAGVWTLANAGAVQKFAVIERDGQYEVSGGGGRWLVRLGPTPPATAARAERHSDGRIPAPLPATVLGVHVEVGEQVERGQPLVTLYAMKMELICEAPAAGVIDAISCQVGELVDADQLLVSLKISERAPSGA